MATIKVKATQLGFYNGSRIREGAVFSIEEKQFSSKWMVRQPDEAKATVRVAVKPLKAVKAVKADEKGTLTLPQKKGGQALV